MAQFELRVQVEALDDVAVAAVITFPSAMMALQVEVELASDLQAPSLGFNLKTISASVTTNDDVVSSGCCPTLTL